MWAADIRCDEPLCPRPAELGQDLEDAMRRLVPPHVLGARTCVVAGENDRVRQVGDKVEQVAPRLELALVPRLDEVVGELAGVASHRRRHDLLAERPTPRSSSGELHGEDPLLAPGLRGGNERGFEGVCEDQHRVSERGLSSP